MTGATLHSSCVQVRYVYEKNVLVVLVSAVLLQWGCSDAMTSSSSSIGTAEQHAVSESYQFSRAPQATASSTWEIDAVEYDTENDEALYITGDFSSGGSLDFGCGAMDNPGGSLSDAFLIKLNIEGTCLWQRHFKNDVTEKEGTRMGMFGVDLAMAEGEVIVAYNVTVEFGFSNLSYGTGYRVRQYDPSGNRSWQNTLSVTDGEEERLTAIDARKDGNAVVASGKYDSATGFAGDSLPHQSGDQWETMVLQWDAARSAQWAVGFGGQGDNVPNDIAIRNSNGDVAVVGDYHDAHTHVNGTQADPATNSSVFIQTINASGNHIDAVGSQGNPTRSDDRESATAVDFNSNGEVFVGGWFEGKLVEQNTGSNLITGYNHTNPQISTKNNSSDDSDFFVVRYAGPGSIGSSTWEGFSDWHRNSTNNPVKTAERILGLSVEDDYVAVTGLACDARTECSDEGFVHVYDFSGANTPITPSFAGTTETYRTGYGSTGEVVDLDESRFAVGGFIGEPNYSFGGSRLPGEENFVVGYTF